MLIKMDEGRWDIIKLGTQRCRCLEPEPSTELPISRQTAETKAVYKPSNLINRAVIQNDHRTACGDGPNLANETVLTVLERFCF